MCWPARRCCPFRTACNSRPRVARRSPARPPRARSPCACATRAWRCRAPARWWARAPRPAWRRPWPWPPAVASIAGLHTVALVFVTASGKTMPSPVSSLTVGQLAGPHDGAHRRHAHARRRPRRRHPRLPGDVRHQLRRDEHGRQLNAVATSAVVGPAAAAWASRRRRTPWPASASRRAWIDYKVTFTNATGESTPGTASNPVSTEYVTGQTPEPDRPHARAVGARARACPTACIGTGSRSWMPTARRAWARRAAR